MVGAQSIISFGLLVHSFVRRSLASIRTDDICCAEENWEEKKQKYKRNKKNRKRKTLLLYLLNNNSHIITTITETTQFFCSKWKCNPMDDVCPAHKERENNNNEIPTNIYNAAHRSSRDGQVCTSVLFASTTLKRTTVRLHGRLI